MDGRCDSVGRNRENSQVSANILLIWYPLQKAVVRFSQFRHDNILRNEVMRLSGSHLLRIGLVISLLGVAAAHAAENTSKQQTLPDLSSLISGISKSSKAYQMLPAQFQQSEKVIFATNPAYPPTTFRDAKSDQMRGVAIDLTNALAQKLGVNIIYKDSTGSGYIPGILSGRYDAAVANIGDHKIREKKVDFVDYAKTYLKLIVPKGNPDNIHNKMDFCGKTFAVLKGSISVDVLSSISESKCKSGNKITINQMETDAEAQLQLLSGRADGDLVDVPAAIYAARHVAGGRGLQVVDSIGELTSAWVGYAVSKETPKLSNAIQQALIELKKDGIYKQIYEAWGLEGTMIDKFYINGATSHPMDKD